MEKKEVTLIFTGNTTIDEVYQIKIQEIKEAIALLDPSDKEGLLNARRDVLELLAILENKQAMGLGLKLTQAEGL